MQMCWFFRRSLVAYQAGMLGQQSSLRMARHLAACPACQQELQAQRRLTSLLHSLPPPSRPETYWSGALQQLQMKIRQRPPESGGLGWFDYLTGFATNPAHALVSVALVGMALFGTVIYLGLEDEALIFFISYVLPMMLY
jgi:anti-sigma factor RsiW